MDFTMFTQLFNIIDQTMRTYVTDISSKAVIAITPIVSTGLTIAFIVYAWLIIRGAIDMPVSGFISRCLRISIITSIALTAGLYQREIADLIIQMPNDLLNALINNPPNNNQLNILIDTVAEKGFKCASKAFEEATFLDAGGLLYGLFGILILLATSFLAAIGGAFILLAKIALVLLVGLGPLFIIALLWQSTYRFFEQWIAQILNYTILIVLLATVFSLMMNIFANYITDLDFDGSQNVGYALGGALILSIISIILLLKLSSIANALAKGVTFEHLWRFNTAGSISSRNRRTTK
ncbi:type IV secretion system protein [Bartonella gliris]|uniref:type IV secretion system protein n=1 Tax=Bartonella gliris TaxID=3004109 RepID=UPI00295F1484|nr:type IV secretion system protein [Bartonella gliris]